MDKKKVNTRHLLVSLFLLSAMHSYCQELFTKELKWESCDSIETLTFQNKDQLIEWSRNQTPYTITYQKELLAKSDSIYIVMDVGCSGLPCWFISIFLEENGQWQLITRTNARLVGRLEAEIDNNHEKLIFKTESGQIGELSFDWLDLCKSKSEK